MVKLHPYKIMNDNKKILVTIQLHVSGMYH